MTTDDDGLTLELKAVIPAPPRRLFALLTEPEQWAKWWGPAGFSIPALDSDLRVDGAYRIAMQPPDGELFHLRGVFREIEEPARLSYTFAWEEPDPDDRETLVTLTLLDRGDSTELHLRQGPFATEARRALHEGGWSDSLEKLRELAASG